MEDQSITRLRLKIRFIEGSIKGRCWNLKPWGGSRIWEENSTQLRSLTEIKWSFNLSPNNCSVAIWPLHWGVNNPTMHPAGCNHQIEGLEPEMRGLISLFLRGSPVYITEIYLYLQYPFDSNYFPYATIDIYLLTRGWHILWDLLSFSGH